MRLIDADKLKEQGFKICKFNNVGTYDIVSLDVIPTAFDATSLIDLADAIGGMGGAYIRKECEKLGVKP